MKNLMTELKHLMQDNNLTKQQVKQIRQELGFFQGTYTKKQLSQQERKAKRSIQKTSRKKNRIKTKGQKNSKGARYRMN